MRVQNQFKSYPSARLVLLILAASCLAPNCATDNRAKSTPASEPSPIDCRESIGSESRQWAVNRIEVSLGERLTDVKFISEQQGWVSSDTGTLFETTDGGKRWHRISVVELPSGHLASISLINPSLAWVIQWNDNLSRLIYTYDAGKTWQVQYSSDSSQLSRVRFINDYEGWVIGAKVVQGDATQQTSSVVLHTTNQGKQWVDVSDNVNREVVGTSVTDVYAFAPSKAVVLTADGQIFRTEDGGQKWVRIEAIRGDLPQTFFSRIGALEDGGLWILGGANSKEGRWGLIAHMNSDAKWKNFRSAIHLNDALFLTSEEVIACGRTEKGMIVHSTDGGCTWEKVYSDNTADIKSLTLLNSKAIYAITDNGIILHLHQ